MSEPPREAIHHRSWDSDHQDGHSDRDWRKCSEWPCVALAASEPPSDPERLSRTGERTAAHVITANPALAALSTGDET